MGLARRRRHGPRRFPSHRESCHESRENTPACVAAAYRARIARAAAQTPPEPIGLKCLHRSLGHLACGMAHGQTVKDPIAVQQK